MEKVDKKMNTDMETEATLGHIKGYIRVILGIMETKMESTVVYSV